MNGQPRPDRLPCSAVEKDDFTGHYSVTMVMIAMRNISYPTWECGGLLSCGLSLLLGQRDWPLEQVSRQLPADSRACLFSKKQPLLPTPGLRVGK